MYRTFSRTLLLAIAAVLAFSESQAQDAVPETVEFNRDIRPILSDNCIFCHGPDKNKREADLRLDTKEGLHGTSEHVGALVPGMPDESELFQRITSIDDDKKMPPAKSGKVLSERDVQVLKK